MMQTFAISIFLTYPSLVLADLTFYSYTLDKCYKVTVTRAALLASPTWERANENPPLSARKAIQLAMDKKDTLVRDTGDWVWELESASLKEADEGRWFWSVRYEAYRRNGNSEGVPPFLRLVVLMDGSVIEPKVIDGPRR